MHVGFLRDHRQHIETLAAWHHAEWGHLFQDWTLEKAAAELEDHATRDTLPTTLVGFDGEVPLGSVSLLFEDAPELDDFGSPWLASLYVPVHARGRGFGAQLVKAALAHASAQGVARLFLFTPGHATFYQRLGWHVLARTQVNATAVDVMVFVTAIAVAGVGKGSES